MYDCFRSFRLVLHFLTFSAEIWVSLEATSLLCVYPNLTLALAFMFLITIGVLNAALLIPVHCMQVQS